MRLEVGAAWLVVVVVVVVGGGAVACASTRTTSSARPPPLPVAWRGERVVVVDDVDAAFAARLRRDVVRALNAAGRPRDDAMVVDAVVRVPSLAALAIATTLPDGRVVATPAPAMQAASFAVPPPDRRAPDVGPRAASSCGDAFVAFALEVGAEACVSVCCDDEVIAVDADDARDREGAGYWSGPTVDEAIEAAARAHVVAVRAALGRAP